MDYTSEEFQRNRRSHKKRFRVVLQELVRSWKNQNSRKNIYETIHVKHEYVEFLQYIDFQRDLKIYYPDLVASIGHKYRQIELEGPACQVIDATVIIKEQIHSICEKHLTTSQSNLIWNIVAKNLWNEYFAKQLPGKAKRKVKVCIGPSNTLVILAFSEEECERAFEILFEIIREDTLVISKDFPILSDKFQALITKLQRGTLVQIEVSPDVEENVVRIIGAKEDVSRATQEISDFINENGQCSDAYRPQVSQYVWDFLARHVDHERVKQIEKDLEAYNVSIQISDDQEFFLVHGINKGIEQSKKRLGELASIIVEKEKKLEYPGVKRLFTGKVGKEQLVAIEREMDVEIGIVRSGQKMSKKAVPIPRALSIPAETNNGSNIYDMCNVTTKEGLRLCWKHGDIENEVADVLVNCAHSNLNYPTACGRALRGRGGLSFKEACKPFTAIQPGHIVVTESGNLFSKHVIHAVCRNLCQFKEASHAHEFLRGLIRKILEKSRELGASSIAMPMVGAGEHRFPVQVVSQVIRSEVDKYSRSSGEKILLKEVRIIVSQPEPESKKTASSTPDQKELNGVSCSGPKTFGSVRIYLCTGNATQYQAKALIHILSENSKLLTTASKSIDSIDIRQLGEEMDLNNSTTKEGMRPPSGAVVVAKASDGANIDYRVHSVPASFDVLGLERAMKACLDAADFLECDTVVIPATSLPVTFNISASEFAGAILNAFHTFSNASTAMDVRLVELDDEMLQIFTEALEMRAKEKPTNAAFHESDDLPANEILSFGTKEEVTLRVVGFRNSVNMSINRIEAYFNRCKVSKSIQNRKMVHRLWKHKSELKRLVKGYEVSITLSPEEARIEGSAEQVFECKDVLADFLSNLDEKEEELEKLRKISEGVQWSYSDANCNVLFDEILNGMVENEFGEGKKKFTIPNEELTYDVDFDEMIIQERHTGHSAALVRKRLGNTLASFHQ